MIYCNNEVEILKQEKSTIVELAKTQSADVKRYLDDEVRILGDSVQKSYARQKAENSRLYDQIGESRDLGSELDSERLLCVRRLARIQGMLGVQTDPGEEFMRLQW